MKQGLVLAFITFFSLNSLTFAGVAKETIYEEKTASAEFSNQLIKLSHLLVATKKTLLATAPNLPTSTDEAQELLLQSCSFYATNPDSNKYVRLDYNNFLTTVEFYCDSKNYANEVEAYQFIATVGADGILKDLQVSLLKTELVAEATKLDDGRQIEFREVGKVLLAFGASTLTSGILAKKIYAGENDKFLHATAGNLIAVTTAIVSYYGFKLSKNESILLGLATAAAAALLKEYVYDARRRDTHTVSRSDVAATIMGGATGMFFMTLNFKF